MNEVVLYGRVSDPYMVRARALLNAKNVRFTEKELPEYSEEMQRVTGASEGPQIVIGGRAIGSFDALGSLELKGELDRLLVAKPAREASDSGKDLSTNKK